MISLEMPVVGFGELYEAFFNAIVMVFGEKTYKSFLYLTIAMAGFSVLASLVIKRDLLVFIRWFFYVYVCVYLLFLPKCNLYIIETIRNKPYKIENVPLGLGILASVSSQLSYNLTLLLDKNFSLPDDIKYNSTGMVFSAQVVRASTQFEITDQRFENNLQSFIQQCVLYDVLLDKYTINELIKAEDLWNFFANKEKLSPIRGIFFIEKNNNKIFKTCRDSYTQLESEFKTIIDDAFTYYGKILFPNKIKPKDLIQTYLPASFQYLSKAGQSQAESIMKQMMLANSFDKSIIRMGTKLEADSTLKAYSIVKANSQKRMTSETISQMAAYWLPLIKICLECILYACFIFVVLMSVFISGERILKSYLTTVIWIQIWPPLFAIFNGIISLYGQYQISNTVNSSFSIVHLPLLQQMTSDLVSLAGFMSIMVPMVAGFVVWGAQHSFAQLAQASTGVIQSASAQAASEAVGGNFSLGNSSFLNQNAFNTNENKIDTNKRVSTGDATLQLGNAATVTKTMDGTEVWNTKDSISNLPIDIDWSRMERLSLAKSGEKALSAANNASIGYTKTRMAVAKNASSLSHMYSESEGKSDTYSMNVSSNAADALSSIEKTNRDLQERFNLSHTEAEQLASSVYASGGIGTGKIPVLSFNLGGSRTATNTNANLTNDDLATAKSILEANQYSKNVDIIHKAVQDESLRFNDENSMKAAKDLTSAFEKSDALRKDMSANLQKAETFKKQESYIDDTGIGYRENLNQQFISFLNEKIQNGQSGYLSVEQVLKDENARGRIAQEFIDQKVHASGLKNFNAAPKSEEEIKEFFKDSKGKIATIDIGKVDDRNAKQNQQQLEEMGIKFKNPDMQINKEAKQSVTNKLAADAQKIYQDKNTLELDHDEFKQKLEGTKDRYFRTSIAQNILYAPAKNKYQNGNKRYQGFSSSVDNPSEKTNADDKKS